MFALILLPMLSQGQIYGPPSHRQAQVQSLQDLRATVVAAWLNPSPANVARLPDYPQVQGLIRAQGTGQCASYYFGAGDMIKRHMMDQVSAQIGRGDTCSQRYGIVFDEDQNQAAGMGAPPTASPQGEHQNSNGCVVRGDSTRCPPSVSQMNNYSAVKLSPAEVSRQMGLAADLSADELWEMGNDYYQRRLYTQASGVFWRGANLHDPRAQAALGNMYASGIGIAQNDTLGMYWLGEGARGGNRGAQYAVAVYWEDGTQLPPNLPKAMSWYVKSAQQAFPRAELRVGFGYYFGEGLPVNKPVGLQWIRKAATDGYGPASVAYETITSPSSPKFRNFDEFSAYIAKLQAIQTERTLAIMRSGLRVSAADRNGWAEKAKALEGAGEYSRASSCRAIGTYC